MNAIYTRQMSQKVGDDVTVTKSTIADVATF